MVLKQGPQRFFVRSQHVQSLGAGRVTRIKFRTEGAQILGATLQRVVAQAALRPGFLHPWPKEILSLFVLIKGWFLRSRHTLNVVFAHKVVCNPFSLHC
jgi:hypothetical protein